MMLAYILRGITGSGKSSFARTVASRHFGQTKIHSTDDLFMDDGVYRFDPRKLDEYHKKNREEFEASMRSRASVVICDNTNSRVWEYEPYVRMARHYGYALRIIAFPHPPIEMALKRSVHGVPRRTIERMIARFEYDPRATFYTNGDL